MESAQAQSEYIAFFDECGDHSMTNIDPDFPLFVLSAVIVRREEYSKTIIPAIGEFKLRYWDHEGVNLHSRNIRKADGPFAILQNPVRREKFLAELSGLMVHLPYSVFVVGIRKADHRARYGVSAINPYELALTFIMERILFFLMSKRQSVLPVVAEARGKNEDNALQAAFYKLTTNGSKFVSKEKFRNIQFPLLFHDKRENIIGIQIADLCAHPSARHILNPGQPNQAFDIVKTHICREGTKEGWKVFP